MNRKKVIYKSVNFLMGAVWLTNGLFCKVLNFVPRHQLIVAKILGNENAGSITKIIGALEILMAIWILSSFKSRWCAVMQIAVIICMNCLEFFLAPDLLLFGKLNLINAVLLAFLVYYNEFVLKKKFTQ